MARSNITIYLFPLPKKLREEDKLTPDMVFRDPYFLDFLGLKGASQEKDIESAIPRIGELLPSVVRIHGLREMPLY